MELEHYILTVGGKTMKAFSRWLLVAILFSLILRSIGMNANTTTLALTILSIVYLGVYLSQKRRRDNCPSIRIDDL